MVICAAPPTPAGHSLYREDFVTSVLLAMACCCGCRYRHSARNRQREEEVCYYGLPIVKRGAVAQLGARLDGIEEVVGSNPIGSTTPFFSLHGLSNSCFESCDGRFQTSESDAPIFRLSQRGGRQSQDACRFLRQSERRKILQSTHNRQLA